MPVARYLRDHINLLDQMQAGLKCHIVALKDTLSRWRDAGQLRLLLIHQRVRRKADSRVVPPRCHRKRERLESLL